MKQGDALARLLIVVILFGYIGYRTLTPDSVSRSLGPDSAIAPSPPPTPQEPPQSAPAQQPAPTPPAQDNTANTPDQNASQPTPVQSGDYYPGPTFTHNADGTWTKYDSANDRNDISADGLSLHRICPDGRTEDYRRDQPGQTWQLVKAADGSQAPQDNQSSSGN